MFIQQFSLDSFQNPAVFICFPSAWGKFSVSEDLNNVAMLEIGIIYGRIAYQDISPVFLSSMFVSSLCKKYLNACHESEFDSHVMLVWYGRTSTQNLLQRE